jgi:hypothetical protein
MIRAQKRLVMHSSGQGGCGRLYGAAQAIPTSFVVPGLARDKSTLVREHPRETRSDSPRPGRSCEPAELQPGTGRLLRRMMTLAPLA